MRPPSKPTLNKSNPNKWFISWNHDVPHQLWDRYPRRRVRIKIYDNINRFSGAERDEYAEHILKVWQYNVTKNGYNPFEAELNTLLKLSEEIEATSTNIISIEQEISSGVNIVDAMEKFIESRKFRTDNSNSISTWSGMVKWLTEWLSKNGLLQLDVTDITRKHVSDALAYQKSKKDKDGKPIWSNRTYNNNLSNVSSMFNYFVKEEMITTNPFKGKIDKLKTTTGKNKWYTREQIKVILPYVKDHCPELYYAFAFTYYVAVRSQQELIKLKVSDIDFSLNRIRFRKEVSKNGKEEYREWPDGFLPILLEMKLQQVPGDYYIFGKAAKCGPSPCAKNTLANYYRPIKEKLGIGIEHTIYSFKHTRVVHEMMKGTDPYEIQYICRHSSLEETQHYMRGFDITLRNVYEAKDLTF